MAGKKGLTQLECRLWGAFLIFLLGSGYAANAQATGSRKWAGWAFEQSIHYGVAIQHSPKIRAPLSGFVYGAEVNVAKQTTGRKTWEARHRRPELGIAISYLRYANPGVYGDAIGFMPNITFGTSSRKKVYAHFRLGVGLAVLTKPYHPVDNPTNVYIGSYLNNMTSLRFGLGFRLSEQVRLHASVCLTHCSNGGSQMPNLGINTATGLLGLYYQPCPYRKDELRPDSLPARPREKSRRWHGVVTGGLAQIERMAPGGPKFWLPSVSIEIARFLSPVNRLGLGFLWEYDQSRYQFLRFSQNWAGDPAEQSLQSQRFAVYLADEIFFGKLSMNFQAGGYIVQAENQPKPYFARLGLRYYFRPADAKGLKPHVGVYLKAHNTTAEYVGFGLGFAW